MQTIIQKVILWDKQLLEYTMVHLNSVGLSNFCNNITKTLPMITCFIIMYIAIFYIFFYFSEKKRLKNENFSYSKKNMYLSFSLMIVMSLCLLGISETIANILKLTFGRYRPGYAMGIYNRELFCFPSAHSLNTMSMVCFLIFFTSFYSKHWKIQINKKGFYFFVALILFSLMIGLARFLDNNHFFLDVFCGWIIGIILSYTYYKLCLFIYRTYLFPSE